MLRQISRFLTLIGLSVLLTQCQTLTLDMRKSGTLPLVEIQGVYFAEIVNACADVLGEEDFRLAGAKGPRRIYEKPASTMDFLAWGGFYSDDEMVIRLNVYIRELGVDAFEVECQPFIVTNVGRHMEDARKISRLKGRKYQRLLNRIRDRALAGRPAGVAGGYPEGPSAY